MTKCKHCGSEIADMPKTLVVKELGIEVQTEISQKGITFKDLIIPKGWRLLTVNEIIYLYNNYANALSLLDTWEFIEQPFKRNNSVARFYAYSDRAGLDCYRDPDIRDDGLGVRFCRSKDGVK
jgi:hypothetical protein